MKQVAVAVAYTHANKLAHMDIKPESILLDETKTLAKLCGFDCA
jgi:serine/threonine protein kinase